MSWGSDLVVKALIALIAAVLCGAIGFVVPQLFDRDVGSALASAIFGAIGAILGAFLSIWAVRRIFD